MMKCSDLAFERSLLHHSPARCMPLVWLLDWRDAGKSEIRAQTFHRPAGYSCLKPWCVYVSCLVAGLGYNTAKVWKKGSGEAVPLVWLWCCSLFTQLKRSYNSWIGVEAWTADHWSTAQWGRQFQQLDEVIENKTFCTSRCTFFLFLFNHLSR